MGVVAGTDCYIMWESRLRFTNHWHSTATCTVISGFCSIFDRILVRTSDLNPHTNRRHLNCASMRDEIFNCLHSFCWCCRHTLTASYFVKFKQLKQILKKVNWSIGLAVRVFANGPGDRGSIPGRVIPKTQKMVLDDSLLNTQHYNEWIKGKMERSRERSSALPYTFV